MNSKSFIFFFFIHFYCFLASDLLQIDKLHLITPKFKFQSSLKPSLNQFFSPKNSINRILTSSEDQTSQSNDQVASIQYELKIVQQKPITVQKSVIEAKKLNEKVKDLDDISDKVTTQSTQLLQSSSQNFPHNSKELKQLPRNFNENPSETKQNNFVPNYEQVSNREIIDHDNKPEVKKIVHIHYYHHEHLGDGKMSKYQEKEQEKKTEKMVEKQVQEAVLKKFEEELEKETELESETNDKKKSASNDDSEEDTWRPVKYSQVLSKLEKKKKPSSEEEYDSYHQDYQPYAHYHEKDKRKIAKPKYENINQKSIISKKKRNKKTLINKKPSKSFNDQIAKIDDDQLIEKLIDKNILKKKKNNKESEEDFNDENNENSKFDDNLDFLDSRSRRSKIPYQKQIITEKINKQINYNKFKKKDNYDDTFIKNVDQLIRKTKKLHFDKFNDEKKSFKEQRFKKKPEKLKDLSLYRRKDRKLDDQPFIDKNIEPFLKKENMIPQNFFKRNWLGLELITKS